MTNTVARYRVSFSARTKASKQENQRAPPQPPALPPPSPCAACKLKLVRELPPEAVVARISKLRKRGEGERWVGEGRVGEKGW